MVDISDLLGIPYKEHGRSKAEGFDCYGLAIEIGRRMGKNLNDVIYENHSLALADEYAPTLNVEETDRIEEGTILEMDYKGNLHIGVCLNNREFIHATSAGVRVNRIGAIKIRRKYKWV